MANDKHQPTRSTSYDKKVGLVLQGGGALGSYQAGVYEALASSEYSPDWVAGISIGAINAAIIAGNAPEHRVQRLHSFWDDITATTEMWPSAPAGPLAEWQNRASALTTVMFGQPGFFRPRPPQHRGMASTPQPSQAELVASNARLWAGGGCIFADASNAGTSAAVILHQVSMHRNITRLRVTR